MNWIKSLQPLDGMIFFQVRETQGIPCSSSEIGCWSPVSATMPPNAIGGSWGGVGFKVLQESRVFSTSRHMVSLVITSSTPSDTRSKVPSSK